MKRVNIRYGVVNDVLREIYEKEFQVPFGYDYMTYSENEAIAYCRSLKGDSRYKDYLVEKIFNNGKENNNKEVIFRGGDEKIN